MTWFLLAITGPFLYAITNHIDKNLLAKYFKEGGVGTLILFSALLSVLPIPIFYLLDPSVLEVTNRALGTLLTVGLLHLALLWFYLKALEDEEATVVIIFYQIVPIMGLLFGWGVLGETINKMQGLAMFIVLIGTSLVAFETIDNKIKFKWNTIKYMLLASVCWAAGDTLFKYVALEQNVVRSLFWEHVVLVLAGVVIFILVPMYRKHFMIALQKNSTAILSLNILNEVIYIGANVVMAFPLLMVPVGILLLSDTFQPLFVLIIAIFLTIFFPKVIAERVDTGRLVQKILSILITGVGVYILLTNTVPV